MTLFNWFKKHPAAPAAPPSDPLPEWVQRLCARMADPEGWARDGANDCTVLSCDDVSVRVRFDIAFEYGFIILEITAGDAWMRRFSLSENELIALEKATAALIKAHRDREIEQRRAAFAATILERLPPTEPTR